MTRRGVLLAGTVAAGAASRARADAEFPAAVEAGGVRLVLNGIASRLYSVLGVEIYRAALYMDAPTRDAAAILASSRPRLIEARYRRAVPLAAVAAAWEQALGAPAPGPFGAWLRPISAGDVERQLFLADGALLDGLRRPPARIQGPAFARRLLDCWIGAAAPSEGLRRGLLGLT